MTKFTENDFVTAAAQLQASSQSTNFIVSLIVRPSAIPERTYLLKVTLNGIIIEFSFFVVTLIPYMIRLVMSSIHFSQCIEQERQKHPTHTDETEHRR